MMKAGNEAHRETTMEHVTAAIVTKDAAAVVPATELTTVVVYEEQYGALVVRTSEAAADATKGIQIIGAFRKGLADTLKEKTAPLKERVKVFDLGYKPLIERLERIEARLKEGILSWRREEQRARDLEAERVRLDNLRREKEAAAELERQKAVTAADTIKEASAAGFTPAEAVELAGLEVATIAAPAVLHEAPPPPVPTKIHTELGGARVVKRWTYDVVDKTQVPMEFLEVHPGNVRKAINDGAREIPGLKIYQTESLSRA